ncbi:Putative translocator [Mycobacteroides abscessus subsp. bolletii]|uniref:LysE family translocator n=1 Tax=Mycobacteroides abscessus TaxID=36809 RepID=UPI0009297557|nr:LysE family transporter [Mycobacteroides abscessus]SIK04176.1 Putative translocator [Mycobacteroides abscessus subsp. bolletii]
MSLPMLLAFALIPILSPGPSTIVAARNAVTMGSAAAYMLLLADITGTLIASILLQIRLSPLLADHPGFLTFVKIAAVGYILYIGVQQVGRKSTRLHNPHQPAASISSSSWTESFFAGLLNPKTVVFFCLIPVYPLQEMNEKIVTAFSFTALKAVVLVSLVTFASFLARLSRSRISGKVITKSLGWFLITLGIFLSVELSTH